MKWKMIIPLTIILILIISSLIFILNKPKKQPLFEGYLKVSVDKHYSETCYPQGQVMEVLPNNKCCENTQELGIIDSSQPGCAFVSGVVLCSDCGNKKCDYGEDNCNCPEDCK